MLYSHVLPYNVFWLIIFHTLQAEPEHLLSDLTVDWCVGVVSHCFTDAFVKLDSCLFASLFLTCFIYILYLH